MQRNRYIFSGWTVPEPSPGTREKHQRNARARTRVRISTARAFYWGRGLATVSPERFCTPSPGRSQGAGFLRCWRFSTPAPVVFCRHNRRRGNLIPAPGKRAEEMPQAEERKRPRRVLAFSEFSDTFKRGISGLFRHYKKGFLHLLQSNKRGGRRGTAPGLCATIAGPTNTVKK